MRKNKPAHLSTGKILIRVFRYALRSKFLLLAALLFLFVFSVLEIAQPLIIKRVIDDELAGVATVWTEVDTENEKTVRFDGKLYVKGALDGPRYTIRYYKDGYLLIDGEIPEKDNIVSIGAQAVIAKSDGGTYVADYRILTREEMRLFFEPSIKPITLMIILYAAVTIVILLARFLQRIAFTTSSLRLSLEMRKNMFQKMNRLPVAYFSTEPSGKIVTKMIYDTEGVRGLYEVMFSIVSSIVSLVMIYAGFFYLDWKLALFTLAAFP